MKKHIMIVSLLLSLLICSSAGGCSLIPQTGNSSESSSAASSDASEAPEEGSQQETEENDAAAQPSALESSESEAAGSDAESEEPSAESSEEESSEISYVSMTESEAMEASNEGYEFDDEQIVEDYHTAETFTNNDEFNQLFSENALDKAFDEELKSAASSTEMRNIITKYAESWKDMADKAYSELDTLLNEEDKAKLSDSQEEWKAGLEEMENSFYEEAKTAGSEGLIAADSAIMNYYKGRAAKLFEQIYTINGSIDLSAYGL